MEWSLEKAVLGGIAAICVIGIFFLARRKEAVRGKLYMFAVVAFVICALIYAISAMQFGDGTEGFRIGLDWIARGARAAGRFFGRMIA